jgi:hypothetical protein
MAQDKTLNLIFLFVGAFLLVLIAIAGLNAYNQDQTTDTSDTQDTDAARKAVMEGQQQPFVLALSGLQMILLVVLVLGGIGVFITAIWGRGRHRI